MSSAIRLARDTMRPLIGGQLEYQIRRGISRIIPIAHRSAHPHVAHACLWKTGSQWVRLILSDPRMLRWSGHLPYMWNYIRDDARSRSQFQAAPRSLALIAYAPPEQIAALSVRDDTRCFFVVRDPRKMLVSWYYSTRYTHRSTPAIEAHRAAVHGQGDAEAFSYFARAFVAEFGPIFEGWSNTGENALVVRFEDLTGPEGLTVWRQVLDHLDWRAPKTTLERVLDTYSIEKLAPSRRGYAKEDKYAMRGQRDLSLLETLDPINPAQKLLFEWGQRYGYDQ